MTKTTRTAGAEPPITMASLNGVTSSPQTVTTSYVSPGYAPSPSGAVPVSSVPVTSGSAVPAGVQARTPAELEAEIVRLRSQLAAAQGGAATRSGAVMQKSSGVPVHIVAAIAVGVFAVTYLFF